MEPNLTHTSQVEPRARPQPWELAPAAQPWYVAPDELERLAASFDPISLEQMDAVALLDRIDTKYVMPRSALLQALAAVRPDYWMLAIGGRRLHHYRTLYFDTPDFAMYRAHVNQRADRYKLRSREYADSRRAFIEVKHKTPKDRTIKARLATAAPVCVLTPEIEAWLAGALPIAGWELEPKLWNTFTRLTLVSRSGCERLTLDVDLTFYTAERAAHLDGVAIAEVKTAGGGCASPFLAQMLAQRLRPHGFSKYVIGVAALVDDVKKNSVKPQRLWLEKMMRGMQ